MWDHERPVRFMGVVLRSRTTVVRLDNGTLWVHSPAPPDSALKEAIDALGEVAWLVLPNKWHHLGASAAIAAWPGAQVVAASSLVDRRPDLRPDHVLGRGDALWPEFEVLPLDGVPYLDETCFFHRPTQTLVSADLLIQACDCDHWSMRALGRVAGIRRRPGRPPDVRLTTPLSDEARRSVARMLALPIQRVCAAHMSPIEQDAAGVLALAWDI